MKASMGRTAADQLHCASGVAQRDVTRKRFSLQVFAARLAGSLASRTVRDNKHCDAAKFSSDSSVDSFPSGPFRRPFCSSLSPHNAELSSPLKTILSRRLPKTPRPPQPPRQSRFAPAVPRRRAPLVQEDCRRRSKHTWIVLALLESSRRSIAAGLADSRCVFKSDSHRPVPLTRHWPASSPRGQSWWCPLKTTPTSRRGARASSVKGERTGRQVR